MKITIFTPTYNRAYILENLYNSLKSQTCQSFVWLIIDDGSTDNTEELVNSWSEENLIEIQYYKQENQGKSFAHNKAVSLTKTDLFTCVDSDDYLRKDAVELILKEWSFIKNNDEIIGILAFKGKPNGKNITSINDNVETIRLYEGYRKYGLRGDTMLIYRTDIISKYKFPKFDGEKFVPEAYLYDLLDREGKLYIVREILYYCEYLQDGYTKNMAKILLQNPKGYLLFVQQRLENDRNISDKIKNTIRYTAMCIASNQKNYIRKSVYPILTIITFPIAFIFYLKRYKFIK